MSPQEIETLVDVALGNKKADLIIKGGSLLNVYTGELLKGYSVAIKGERIAYVGENSDHTAGEGTQLIDAQGKVLIPGLIDGHTHFYSSVDEFLRYSMVCGTTSIVTETLEIGCSTGYAGVISFLENLKDQPIKLFALAPAMELVPGSIGQGSTISDKEMEQLLNLDEILGLGETMWTAVLEKDQQVLGYFARALSQKKRVEGHSAGAKGNRLVAYIASGISSCHEPINTEEALERLRLGIHVMIREGSIRRELEAISQIKDKGIDFRRLVLVTDGLSPEDLVTYGHMDYLVQKAINLGFDPIVAIQMATINPAEHFSLDHLIGGIAPGRYADILIIPDLRTIHCEYVISNGQIIAKNKKLLVEPRKCVYPQSLLRSIHLPKKLNPEDFAVSARGENGKARVRVISIVSDLITEESAAELPVVDGLVQMDVERDVLKVSVIDRYENSGTVFTGFVTGFGIESGAIATSYTWTRGCPIIAIGADEQDMAHAVNHIAELNGGLVVCKKGAILEELPLPLGGVTPSCPIEEAAYKVRHITKLIAKLGSSLSKPFLTLQTLPSPVLPFFRISQGGLINLREKRIVDLFFEPYPGDEI